MPINAVVDCKVMPSSGHPVISKLNPASPLKINLINRKGLRKHLNNENIQV